MKLRDTHTVDAFGEKVVGTNELGVDLTESNDLVATFRCRYRPEGSGLQRGDTGEDIDSAPQLVIPRYSNSGDVLHETLEVGQTVEIDEEMFTINRIEPHYGNSDMVCRSTVTLS